ncbi:MAG: hypothetical protein IT289_04325 [Oligoflexia bacterium]|nr:hypothetical protein [Oligoflexia bacterium]
MDPSGPHKPHLCQHRMMKSSSYHKTLALILTLTVLTRVLYLCLRLGPWSAQPWVGHIHVDLWGWIDFLSKSQQGLTPYVHFTKEYPVGAGLLYWLMSFFFTISPQNNLVLVHGITMALFDILNGYLFTKLCWSIAPRRTLAAALVFSLNPTSLILSPVRYESAVVLTVLLGALSLTKKSRDDGAPLFWGLGASMKWYPIFFWASAEYRKFFESRKIKPLFRSAMIFVAIWFAVNLPVMVKNLMTSGSLQNWWHTYSFHIHRPLYWDTIFGAVTIWFSYVTWEKYAGLWSLALMAFFFFYRPRQPWEVKGTLICLATLVFNRVYSTQFHLWFYPLWLLFMIRLPRSRFTLHLGLLGAFDLLNILVYPFSFTYCLMEIKDFASGSAALHGGPWSLVFALSIFARAALIVGLIYVLLKDGEKFKDQSLGA